MISFPYPRLWTWPKQDDDYRLLVKFFNLSFVSPWLRYDCSFFSLFARKESQFFFFCAGAFCHSFLFWFVHVSLIWGWFFSLTRFFRLFSCFSLLRDGSCDAKANHPKPNSLFRRIFFFLFLYFIFSFFSFLSLHFFLPLRFFSYFFTVFFLVIFEGSCAFFVSVFSNAKSG